MTTLRTDYQTGEIFKASDINTTNAEVNAKSTVSVSSSGTATDEVSYITVNGLEKKIAGSESGTDVNAVHYTADANKTTEQKTQARTNINAQEALVSGTNIKTINGTSVLGSGDISIDASNIFIAEYNVTTFSAIKTAYNSGKKIVVKFTDLMNYETYAFMKVFKNGSNIVGFVCADTHSSEMGTDIRQVFINSSGWGINDSAYATLWYTQYGQANFENDANAFDLGSLVLVTDTATGVMVNAIKVDWEEEILTFEGISTGGNSIITIEEKGDGTWTRNEVSISQLPTTVNDRYLHTNATTGDLEWSEVQSGSSNIFIATYNTTTFSQLLNAYNSGKSIFAIDSGLTYNLVNYTDEVVFEFSLVNIWDSTILNTINCYSDDTWDSTSKQLYSIYYAYYANEPESDTTYSDMMNNKGQSFPILQVDTTDDTIYVPYDTYASDDEAYVFKKVYLNNNSVITDTYTLKSAGWTKTTSTQGIPQLPTPINDRYLHANTSTGALEWSNVSGLLPVGTATSNALIYNGSDWIQQNGYGYITQDILYSIYVSGEEYGETTYSADITELTSGKLKLGTTYAVTFNEVEYQCTATLTSNGIAIGDITEEFTEIPFLMYDSTGYGQLIATSQDMYIIVEGEVIHPISGKLCNNTFTVSYNMYEETGTSYQDILDAYIANKNIVLQSAETGGFIPLYYYDGESFMFKDSFGTSSLTYTVSSEGWEREENIVKVPTIIDYGTEGVTCYTVYQKLQRDGTVYCRNESNQLYNYLYYTLSSITFSRTYISESSAYTDIITLDKNGNWSSQTVNLGLLLPSHSISDEGKVLKIVSGVPTWTSA